MIHTVAVTVRVVFTFSENESADYRNAKLITIIMIYNRI